MKGLNWFGKFVFFLNALAAVGLLLGYLLPYVPPKSFPLLAVLSLSVPVLILINFAFFLFWLLQVKRQMLLSLIVLLLGINHVIALYKFTRSEEKDEQGTFKLMSYNVKQFNMYEWKDDPDISLKIRDFVEGEDPDFLFVQEYYKGESRLGKEFKYDFIKSKKPGMQFGMAIFSEHPIINSGSLDFPQKGNNNAIFADVVIGNDTLRLINVHMQSHRINAELDELQKQNTETLIRRMANAFVEQQVQAEIVVEKINASPYKVLIAGDFNNTAFSYIYNYIKGDRFTDAFKEAGNGFGKTFENDLFPLRIDFILVDEGIEIDAFKKFEVPFSDHYPIMATLKLGEAED